MRSRLILFLPILAARMISGCGPASLDSTTTADPGPVAEDTGKDTYHEPVFATGDLDLESDATRDLEQILFESINKERETAGLPILEPASDLASVARKYSEEMARSGVVAHVSPVSGGPGDRVRRAGISFVRLTENLAKAPNAASAHEGLMNSPGHRANILDADVSICGVGVTVIEEEGVTYILATQLFATRPEKIEGKKAAVTVLGIVNSRRKEMGLAPMKRLDWLDKKARKALVTCFSDRPLPSMGLKPSDPVTSANTIGFLVGDLGALEEMIDARTPGVSRSDFTSIGIAVTQGEHPSYGKDIICVRAVVGG